MLSITRVFDAYGHVSVRHPDNPSTFFMSYATAPALVSSKEDLVEYHVDTGEPVNPSSKTSIGGRYIHSGILKRFPAVNSVVHSHSPDVLPYCINDVPLKPTTHMASFLGTEVPIFDIAQHYQSGDSHNLLVRTQHLGEAFSEYFSQSQATYMKVGTSIVNRITGSHADAPDQPDHNVVLMRGHGFTTTGSSIGQAVYQSIYTQTAAKVQTTALMLKTAHTGSTLEGKVDGQSGNFKQANAKPVGELHHLSAKEAADAQSMSHSLMSRAWQLWEREVQVSQLYVNELKKAK